MNKLIIHLLDSESKNWRWKLQQEVGSANTTNYYSKGYDSIWLHIRTSAVMYATLLKIFPPINPNISAFCSQYLLLETRAARAPHFPQILIYILSWVYCAHNWMGSFLKDYYYCYEITPPHAIFTKYLERVIRSVCVCVYPFIFYRFFRLLGHTPC